MRTYYEGPATDDPDWATTGDLPTESRCVRVDAGDSLLVRLELRNDGGGTVYGAGSADLSPVFILTDSSRPQRKVSVGWSPYAALDTDERKVVRFDNMPSGLVTARAWNVDPGGATRMALQLEVIPRAL